MPRPKQRTPELRERILTAALTVLEHDGPGALTTRAVAASADTSVPALYELFGDKAGLVRELFGEGFRRLDAAYRALRLTGDPTADLVATAGAFRRFALEHPGLFAIMFTRPFASVEPNDADRAAGEATRAFLVDRMAALIDAGSLSGNATDHAHAVFGLMIGLAIQETGGWLGSSLSVRSRRWRTAIETYPAG